MPAPLFHQANGNDTLGSMITLRTKPVTDTVDYYVWDLGNGIKPIVSEICSTTYDTRNSGMVTGGTLSGKLFVVDEADTSSSTPFTLILGDSLPPGIVSMNDSISQNGRTLYTGDPFPLVQFKITDNSGKIASVTINGAQFDSCDSGASVYSKNLHRVDTLKNGLQLIVVASDPSQNIRTDTFTLVYSSSILSQNPAISFSIPNIDSSVTQINTTSVAGIVKNSSRFSLLVLSISVNNIQNAQLDTVTPADNSWAWTLALSSGQNTLTVTAFRTINSITDTIAMSSRVMTYDANLVDVTPPAILEIQADSAIVDTVRDTVITTDSTILISALVYDAGSGIKQVLLNNKAMQQVVGSPMRYQDSVPLVQGKSGNLETISVTDNAGNPNQRSITVVRNQTSPDSIFVNFPRSNTLVKEHACTVFVPVALTHPAVSPVQITLVTSGSAVTGTDFNLLTPQISFNTGDSIVSARVQIIDDSLCKPLEKVQLTFQTIQGVFKGTASSSTIEIDSNMQNCKKRVLYVTGNGNILPFDNQVKDTLAAAGYAVSVITESAISTYAGYAADAIFLSQSISGDACGSRLDSVPIPVVCANSPDYLTLGLTYKTDTTSVNMSRIYEKAFDISGNPVKFNDTAVILTSQLDSFTCIKHYTGQGISIASPYRLNDTTEAIIIYFDKNGSLRNGSIPPAKRAAFCMAVLSTNSSLYTGEWWKLLKLTAQWAIKP